MSTSHAPMRSTDVPATCWIVTEGLAGLQNQAKGLAEALGLAYEVKTVRKPGLPWKMLPAAVWPANVAIRQADFAPPWPDVLISCGRCSVAPAISIKAASGGRTFTIHVQDPHVNPSHFDRVIVATHDRLRGANVLVTKGALHRITRQKLDEAFAQFKPLLSPLKRPLYSVLVGGSTRNYTMTADATRDFGARLASLALQTGGSLAVTVSRRTGPENAAILRECLRAVPAYIWDGSGDNPYFGLLAHADAIVVTADSVSMTSEACATGKPVYVYDSGLKSKRLLKFQENLAAAGITRPFTGKAEAWAYPPVDDVNVAAEFVWPALSQHLRTKTT